MIEVAQLRIFLLHQAYKLKYPIKGYQVENNLVAPTPSFDFL